MRVATVDGLVTLFYDGSKERLDNVELENEWFEKYLDHGHNEEGSENWEDWNLSDECKRYWRERQTWQQVIIEEGVTVIPEWTFRRCKNIQRVIFANTVVRIKSSAFRGCRNLTYIIWSINIEVIEDGAFYNCDLTSVFIPPRCREIGSAAFRDNCDLTLFHLHSNVRLEDRVLSSTRLMEESHFELDKCGNYEHHAEEVQEWIRNINSDEKYSLHRACSSYQPLKESISAIIQLQGLRSFTIKNEMGITPSRYLKENPFADVIEKDIIRDYIMRMMGECE